MGVPLAVSVALRDGTAHAFEAAMLAAGTAGAVLRFLGAGGERSLQARDGVLLIVLGWAVLPAFGALPLLIHLPDLGATRAYFEAMSGLTATGATVISGLDRLPAPINLWRGELQWLGGMGVIVLAVAILPVLGVGGRQLLKAEAPGTMRDTQLSPRMAQTAKGLWLVYLLLTGLCALAYRWAGMSWFDAAVHAFSTVSLGGFSSHDASLAYWNSPRIEAVAVVFMLLAGANFATHFVALRRFSAAPYRDDQEIRSYLLVILGSVALICVFLLLQGTYADFATALRFAAFNVVSVATTTGYATADYAKWPVFAPLWMLLISAFAASSGSTGGGIKMMRVQLMCRQALRELHRVLHPNAINPIKLAGRVVDNGAILSVLAYMLAYGTTLTAVTLLLAASGTDPVTALSAAAAALNNLGPGLGAVGPAGTYAGLPDFQLWILTAAMLLGRLELLTVFVMLIPAFWRD